jgi:hypothetical protein
MTPLELDETGVGLVREYARITAEIEKNKEGLQQVRERLELLLGEEHDEARIDGRTVLTWRWSRPARSLNQQALRRDYPELFEHYLTTAPQGARPFRLAEMTP